ncbi:MAG: hypothetical protein CMJ64_16240 [Planctomycetaceae bacterium]|nr:hypothetical protein [Planctomycetaceae bacterium]
MQDLRVHVEKAVRPVVADQGTKLRMREELYSHLLEVFEEERATGDDEAAAILRANDRLGDPAALTAELQATASRVSWYEGAIDRIVHRQDETEIGHACRLASRYLLAIVPLIIVVVPTVWIIQTLIGSTQKSFLDLVSDSLWFGVPFGVFATAQVFFFTIIAHRMLRQFDKPSWRPRSIGGVFGLCAVSTVFLLVSSFALFSILTGNPRATYELMMPKWLIASSLMPFVMTGFVLARRREIERLEPWSSLEIADET